METHLNDITDVLRRHPGGLSITELTRLLPLNRNSLARYLDVLKNSGVISERAIGPAKLYRYEQALPYQVQLELFKRAMDAASCGISIADAQQPDLPLIYVNEEFLKMTGYCREEVLGRNCRFLQGRETRQPGLERLRAALKRHESCNVRLRNFTKSGALFMNNLRIAPIADESGRVTHFVGIQTPDR